MSESTFIKRYATSSGCATARTNYDWLATHARPLHLPGLLSGGGRHLVFEHVHGRHATPVDLEPLATHLGDAQGAAWTSALHAARLDVPYPATDEHTIPDFVTPRLDALNAGDCATMSTSSREIERAIESLHMPPETPVAIYKDANPRNVLITFTRRIVTVDFDDLTLAPFGYDLAKLVVALSMTHGRMAVGAIERALAVYNAAATRHALHLGGTSYRQLLDYAEIHHVLTAPYLGRGGYRYPWAAVRPAAEPGGSW